EVRDIVPPPPRPEDVFLTEDEFLKLVEGAPQVSLKELALNLLSVVSGPLSVDSNTESVGGGPESEVRRPEPSTTDDAPLTTDNGQRTTDEFVLPTEPAPKFHGAIKAFIEDVKSRLAGGERVAFVMPTAGKIERLREILKEYEIPFTTDESEVGNQKSEVRSQKSEPRKSET